MTARKLEAETRGGLAEVPEMQEFAAIPMLTLARFGLWDQALGEPAPGEEHVYLIGVWHYVRGLAQARTGRLAEARDSKGQLDAIAGRPAAESLMLAGGVGDGDVARRFFHGKLVGRQLQLGDQSASPQPLARIAGHLAAAEIFDRDEFLAFEDFALLLKDALLFADALEFFQRLLGCSRSLSA